MTSSANDHLGDEVVEFERALAKRLTAHAAIPIRDVDPYAVAADAARQRRNVPWSERVGTGPLPRGQIAPSLVILTALVAAVVAAMAVGGAVLVPPHRVGSNGAIAYQVYDGEFVTQGQMRTIQPDGSDDTLIARGFFPQFTRDGRFITYWPSTSNSPDPAERADPFVRMATDGSSTVEIARYPDWVQDVSSDGSMALLQAYSSERPFVSDIWLLDIATGERRHLVAHPAEPSRRNENPYFSPDGRMVAYVVVRTVETPSKPAESWISYREQIRVIDIASGEDWSVSQRMADWAGAHGGIDWSPDSRGLAYAAARNGVPPPTITADGEVLQYGGEQGVYVVRVDGSGETLVADVGYAFQPQWSPDGGALAYTAGMSPANRIAIVDMELLRPVGSVRLGPSNAEFVWSPDGQSLALSRVEEVQANEPGATDERHVIQTIDKGLNEEPTQVLISDVPVQVTSWQRVDR